MIGKIFLAILCLFLLVGAFRTPIIDGIKGWRTVDTPLSKSVSPDGDNATIQLDHDLYQAALSNVQTITTNISGAPAAYSYTEATRMLVINGLNPGTQTLAFNYYAETDDEVMRIIGPFLAFFIFFGVAGAIVYSLVSKQGRRR